MAKTVNPHKSLGVVLKTVERCNIDCTYCYMFNMGDESYKKHPPYISLETIHEVACFLKQGIADMELNSLTIEFHGGEPLMQKKHDFNESCNIFKDELGSLTNLDFIMQTNAMLVDQDWIDLFCKHQVGIGVSIDGPKEYHDKERIDHRRRGTYDRVVEKIRLLQDNTGIRQLGGVGILCVINPAYCPKRIYRHFVDDLQMKSMDFLLPYNTYEHPLSYTPLQYGEFLCQLFHEWVKDNNPDIDIRIFNSTLGIFMGDTTQIYGIGPMKENDIPLISIATSGELSPTDEFRTSDPSLIYSDSTVRNISLVDYLKKPIFNKINEAQKKLPIKCQNCCWKEVCAGGAIINRFSQENCFNNPSLYCEGLQEFYSEVAAYLIKKGVSLERLNSRLRL